MNLLSRYGVVVSFAGIALGATYRCEASTVCDQNIPIEACYSARLNQYETEKRNAIRGDFEGGAATALKQVPAALGAVLDSGVLNNFLSPLTATGVSSNVPGVGRDISAGWQPRLIENDGEVPETGDSRMRLAAAQKPALLPVTKTALQQSGESGVASQLEDKLGVNDDWEAGLDYNLTNHIFGRDLKAYRPMLHTLVDSFSNKVGAVSVDPQSLGGELQSLNLRDGVCRLPTTEQILALERARYPATEESILSRLPLAVSAQDTLASYPQGACADQINQIVDRVANLNAERRIHEDSAFSKEGLDHFGDLVANNPQLTFGVARVQRSKLVGADLFAGRVSLELGLGSMAGFLLGGGGEACLRDNDDARSACYSNYQGYVDRNSWFLRHALRIKTSIEYARLEALDSSVTLPSSGAGGGLTTLPSLPTSSDTASAATIEGNQLHIKIPAVSRIAGQFGFGAVLAPAKIDDPQHKAVRLDVVGNYEYFTSHVVYHDSWSLRGTLSYNVAGLTFPLQLFYTGKSEFGADDDLKKHLAGLVGAGYEFGSRGP